MSESTVLEALLKSRRTRTVRQELPDAPLTDAERLVANKFRNEAGDDLRKAMGLSVTSRLLNVHNPLYVKLHFSGKPEAGRLQAFIREYKITAFKRIGDSFRDTFAARFDRIADFDRFCVHDEVKCGSATVTITPCYKYLSCPPSVKTIYANNIAKTKTEASINTSAQKQPDTDEKEKTENAQIKTVTKEVVKKVNSETDKIEITKGNTTNNKTVTTVAKEALKTVCKKTGQTEKTENAETKTVTKEVIQKVNLETKNSEKTQANTTNNKTVTAVAKEAVKTVSKNTDQMEKTVNAETKTVTKQVIQKVNVETNKSEKTQGNTTNNKTVITVAKEAVKIVPKVAQEKPKEIKDTKGVQAEVKIVTPKKVENDSEALTKSDIKEVPTELKKVESKTEVVKKSDVKEVPTELNKVTPKKVKNESEAVTKSDVKEVPTEVKKVTPKKVENKNEVVKKVVDKIKDLDVIEEMMVVDEMGEEDDDEEMTDQDILALMSGGIVLDECSGSDDEK